MVLGNGDGTFQSPITYPTGNTVSALVAGDFNGDGHLDLAVAEPYDEPDNPNGILVFLGNGDGTLAPPTRYAVGTNPNYLVAGDFNNDGRTDLAFGSPDDEGSGVAIWLMEGQADGTMMLASEIPAAFDLVGPLAVGDFNGDGKLDLTYISGDIVILGHGDGTFGPPRQSTVLAGSGVWTGDFNGDGKVDIAEVDSHGNIDIRLGDGDGTFQAPSENPVAALPSGYSYYNLGMADFNRDGRLDLVFVSAEGGASQTAGFSVLLGNGDGTVELLQSNVTGPGAIPDVVGDFNGDGRLDVVVANTKSDDISVLAGNGDGTFQPAKNTVVTNSYLESPKQVIAGDFNGDGRLDLVVRLSENEIELLLGRGDGTFQAAHDLDVFGVTSMVAGDFNGDGKLDLAMIATTSSSSSILLLLGRGDGTFQPPMDVQDGTFQYPYSASGISSSLVAGDFNGDGKLDLRGGDLRSAALPLVHQHPRALGTGRRDIQSRDDARDPLRGLLSREPSGR